VTSRRWRFIGTFPTSQPRIWRTSPATKIRDVLSSILGSAVTYGLLVSNPVENVRMPAERRGRKTTKPYLYPAQFDDLISRIPEPYASMVYVAIYTGLRISELAGLRWDDVHQDSITIDERFCRGDWGAPKKRCLERHDCSQPLRHRADSPPETSDRGS
jgi:integrase